MGPTCIFKALDLGIALGSAVKTASLLNVDNRIMYRIGTAARRLNLLPEATVINRDSNFCEGQKHLLRQEKVKIADRPDVGPPYNFLT